MDNNTVTSQSITSLFNADISYNFYGNPVSFKHLDQLPVGTLAEPIQVFSSGVITKVKVATIKQIHQTTVPRGYKNVPVKFADGKWLEIGTHRLIHFSDTNEWSDKSEGTVIHHINGVKNNNRAENLMLTSSSDNVSRFFDGRDNQSEIACQKYHEERIAKGVTPLTYDGIDYPDYYVTRSGEVFHYVEGERVPVKVYTANKKYPTNRNIKVQGVTMSLTRLVAENFLITPECQYKSLLKNNTLDNPFVAKNIYVMPVKQFK
ncbi:HNH endonuclease [Weissella hellenica]|uniref:HNH endonuclease n=1 Tax=Weissella hellenica TaxID=46256 RepID=UPI0038853914